MNAFKFGGIKNLKRNKAREEAFCALFEYEVTKCSVEEIMETAAESRDSRFDDYAAKLFKTAVFNLAHVDDIIGRYSASWKLERLPKVTTAVLRLALTEILYFDDIPESVSANEAVELAKKFALTEDASYINGILGAFIKDKNKI